MANRISDFQIDRSRFLAELSAAQPELQGYQDYLKYWRTVEAEAQEIQDLDRIDAWSRDLVKDREKVHALKERASSISESDAMHATLVHILKIVLEALDGIGRRLRQMREQKATVMAGVLWRGGPGTLLKKREDDKNDGEKKKDDTAKVVMAGPAQQPQAAKKPEPLVRDKKMER